MLTNGTFYDINAAIESVLSLPGLPLNAFGELQDPWLILMNLQGWILEGTANTTARLPSITCQCGTWLQNLEYS